MKKFEVSFKRIEHIRFMIDGESRADIKIKIVNAEWDLDTEKIDEIENKNFKIEEIKNE